MVAFNLMQHPGEWNFRRHDSFSTTPTTPIPMGPGEEGRGNIIIIYSQIGWDHSFCFVLVSRI